MSALHSLWERVFVASMLQWLGAGAGTGGTPDVAGPEVKAQGDDEAVSAPASERSNCAS